MARRIRIRPSARPANARPVPPIDALEEIRPGVWMFTPAWKVADDARRSAR